MSSLQFSPLAARILQLVGVILILSFLLDFVILSFPFRALDQEWQIKLVTQLVDRGIIAMVGLALLFAGDGIDKSASDSQTNGKAWLDLKLWGSLISILLGLLFLLLFPLHINNVGQVSAQQIEQINQKATQAETELQTKLDSPATQAQLEEQQRQIKALLKNEQQLNQVLQNDRVPEQLKDLLKQTQANPKAVDQILQQQLNAEAIRNQGLTQIRRQKEEAKQQATQEAWKSRLLTGISSLLLTIGYIAIGWMGLRSMGVFQADRSKSSASEGLSGN